MQWPARIGREAGAAEVAPDPALQAALDRLRIAERRPARGHTVGAMRSRVRGRAIEFADYRPYAPGDDPKLVDWRAYTRLGRLYLKQSEEERARPLTLLIDASASLDWGEGDAHKGLYARRLAAALAWIAVGRHEPVQVFSLQAGGACRLLTGATPVVSTRAATTELYRQLAAVREAGGTGLAPAVRAALAQAGAAGPTVLLSDLLDPEWAAALAALHGREGIVLHLLAPDEWEPPLGDEVELEDAETGERRSTRLGPAELAAYAGRLAAFLDAVAATCRRFDLAYLALNTETPLAHTLLRRLPEAGILV